MATETVIVVDGIPVVYGGRLADSKRRIVSIKVSEEELAVIDAAARKLRMSRSEFIRRAAKELAMKVVEGLLDEGKHEKPRR